MGGRQVGLHQRTLMGGVGQEVDMHLVGADLRALMAQMGQVERDGIVLGIAKSERLAAAVLIAADQNVVGLGQGGAAHERIDAMQIAPARCATPVVKRLVERSLGADKRGLIGRRPRGRPMRLRLSAPRLRSTKRFTTGVAHRAGAICIASIRSWAAPPCPKPTTFWSAAMRTAAARRSLLAIPRTMPSRSTWPICAMRARRSAPTRCMSTSWPTPPMSVRWWRPT